MGIVLAFVAGYVFGEQAAKESYADLVTSARVVRDSEEFQALVAAARAHAGFLLRDLAERVAPGGAMPLTMSDVVTRLRHSVRPEGSTAPGS